MKMTILDRILLLLTGLLAAYQIVIGIDKLSTLPIIAYTIAFGVLLVAGLLLIILGFEVLDSLTAYRVRPTPKDLPGKFETGTGSFEGMCGVLGACGPGTTNAVEEIWRFGEALGRIAEGKL